MGTVTINGYPGGREKKYSIQWIADNGDVLWIARTAIKRDKGTYLEVDEDYVIKRGWNPEVLNQTGESSGPHEEVIWECDIPMNTGFPHAYA